MRPLLYLELRQAVNLLKLTLRTPKRLIPVILFGVAVLPSMLGLFLGQGHTPPSAAAFGIQLKLDAVHAGLYLILALGGLYLIQRAFSASLIMFTLPEIDVIIPTPIPRWKFMATKLGKFYLQTGLIFAFATFFLLPTIKMFLDTWSFTHTPIVWLALMMYGALIINVCTIINLIVEYSPPKTGLWPRTLIRAATCGLLLFSVIVFYAGYAKTGLVAGGISSLFLNPVLVALMLPAAWASNLCMAPAVGWTPALGWQLLSLAMLVGVSYVMVLRRRENPYEPSLQISMHFAAMRQAMRTGDRSKLSPDIWKKRAVRMNRVTLAPFGRGATAILWKNLAVALRMWRTPLIGLALIIPAGMLVVRTVIKDPDTLSMLPVFIVGAMVYIMFFFSTGMLNALRKEIRQANILKPIPIPAWQMMAAQTGHIGMLLAAVIWLITASAVVIAGVQMQQIMVYAALGLPFVAYGSICAQLLAVVLYPNMQDVSQQYIGGLLSMLLSGLALGPPILIGVGFYHFKLPILLGLPIIIAVSLAIAVAGISAGAAIYRRHDPTDE